VDARFGGFSLQALSYLAFNFKKVFLTFEKKIPQNTGSVVIYRIRKLSQSNDRPYVVMDGSSERDYNVIMSIVIDQTTVHRRGACTATTST